MIQTFGSAFHKATYFETLNLNWNTPINITIILGYFEFLHAEKIFLYEKSISNRNNAIFEEF